MLFIVGFFRAACYLRLKNYDEVLKACKEVSTNNVYNNKDKIRIPIKL